VRSRNKRPLPNPPFELRKTRVQLEKLEERLLLSAEPLLQVSKPLQGKALTVDNVQLDLRKVEPIDSIKDVLTEANLQAAQVIDLSRGIEQNSSLLSWGDQATGLMKLNQDLGSLVLDMGSGEGSVKVTQDEQGRIHVDSEGSLYDLVFAKPTAVLSIRGGAGFDKVVLDSFSMAGGLQIEAETIELLRDEVVTVDGDVLLQAYSRITQTPDASDAQALASTLVDVQGTLLSKGLITLEARSWVDLQVLRNGSSADLSLKASADATARLGHSSSVNGAGLRVSATSDVRVVAELSGVSSGTLDLQATQSSLAQVLGGAAITIAAKAGDVAPQVLVEASGVTQVRGVVGVAGTERADLLDPSTVSAKINVNRVVLAQVGDDSLGTDGASRKVLVSSADGAPAPSLQVVAYSGDRAAGGIEGEIVSSPTGQQTQRINSRVGASVVGATLNLSSLDVLAMDATSVSAKARVANNQAETSTSSLLRNATVTASGPVTLVALDASRWTAQGGDYTVQFTGDGTLGGARAGNELLATVSARIEGSTVAAGDLRSLAKADTTLTASVLPGKVGPTEQGQLNQWVDSRAQRAWNTLNGGVAMAVEASTLTLTGAMSSGALSRARLSASTPGGALRSSDNLGLTQGDQEESLARNVVGWGESDGSTLDLKTLGGGELQLGLPYQVLADVQQSAITASGLVSVVASDQMQLEAVVGRDQAGTDASSAALALLQCLGCRQSRTHRNPSQSAR
jgi:hypothetical protein